MLLIKPPAFRLDNGFKISVLSIPGMFYIYAGLTPTSDP